MPSIILASSSPYHLEILQQSGIAAIPSPPHIPEPDLAADSVSLVGGQPRGRVSKRPD